MNYVNSNVVIYQLSVELFCPLFALNKDQYRRIQGLQLKWYNNSKFQNTHRLLSNKEKCAVQHFKYFSSSEFTATSSTIWLSSSTYMWACILDCSLLVWHGQYKPVLKQHNAWKPGERNCEWKITAYFCKALAKSYQLPPLGSSKNQLLLDHWGSWIPVSWKFTLWKYPMQNRSASSQDRTLTFVPQWSEQHHALLYVQEPLLFQAMWH